MWDRWAIAAAAALIAGRSFQWGWKLRSRGDLLPAAGAALLGLLAIGVPIFLILLGPEAGR